MADVAKQPKYANTPSGFVEFRMPKNYDRVLGLIRSTNDINTTFAKLESSSNVFDRKSPAGASALAMKLAAHVLTGGSIDEPSTRHLVSEIERDFQDNVRAVLDQYSVVNSASKADEYIRANSGLTLKDKLDSADGKLRKNEVRVTSRGGAYSITVTSMRTQSATTVRPMDEVQQAARQDLDMIINTLAQKQKPVKGPVAGLSGSFEYVSAPIYHSPEQKKAPGLNGDEFAKIQSARDKRSAEKDAMFTNDRYRGMSPQEIAEAQAAEMKAIEQQNKAQAAVEDVFRHVNEKIYNHALEHSLKNAEKHGSSSTALDEEGKQHPYALKKSKNHEGAVFFQNAVRVPRSGNYFFQKGYDEHGRHNPQKAHTDSVIELQDYLKANHPDVDPNVFAREHLDFGNPMMTYFRALTTVNPALASKENSAPDLLIPMTNMNGDLLGVQKIADDSYSHKNNMVKSHMKGTRMTQDDLFMNIGNPINKDTEVLLVGEGAATVESLAVVMFGPHYRSLENVAVIAAIDSNNMKKIVPKLDEAFKEKFGVERNLRKVLAIDNDMKSGIDPFGRFSYHKTREPFEKGETNSRGAKYANVVENAGFKVYSELSKLPNLNASFITMPSQYNQSLSKNNVQDIELTARHDYPDINDTVTVYGLSRARKILDPQVKAASFEVDYGDDPNSKFTLSAKMDRVDATVADMAIKAAFDELSPAQQSFLEETREDAKRLHLAFKNKEFRDFVSDFVAEVEVSSPELYKPFSGLRQSFEAVQHANNMNNAISDEQRQQVIFMLAAVHMASPAVKGDLNTLGNAIKTMADGPVGQKHPEHIGMMANGIDAFLQVPNGDKPFKDLYEEFRQTNFAAVDMISRTYHDFAGKAFAASGIEGAEYHVKRAEDIKNNVYETIRRRIDPEIIAQQLSDEPKRVEHEGALGFTDSKGNLLPKESNTPRLDDDSLSMGM